MAIKFLFERNKALNPDLMIFWKSCVSMVTLLALANADLPKYLKVTGDDRKYLLARVVCMFIGLSCLGYASYYIPQTFMGIG